jgi:Uma2 family endonuclease
MPAALRSPHGRFHGILMTWMGNYWIGTPGTDFLDNATVFLGDNSQPQPDGCLRIPGGQSSENDDEYIVGPPELVAEIASSTESYDLHTKRCDYDRWGVAEYLVFVVSERRVVRFVRQTSGLVELSADSDGILRSKEFPGLWLDPNAFFHLNGQRIVEVLNRGLASAEHAAFVARLAKNSK